MNLAIFIDKFSGHLFHDIELYIILFFKLYNYLKEKNIKTDINISFIKKNNLINDNDFFNAKKLNINKFLCKKLFKIKKLNIVNEENYNKNNYEIIINRDNENTKNLNKAFADYIINFPTKYWYKNIIIKKVSFNNIKILYVSRQNTNRRLSNVSHNNISRIINTYKGTIIDDLGQYSIKKQIEIFQAHNVVIGVHGNNLTGVMWMNPGSFVFEILPFVKKNEVYDFHCMSLCMKHNYTQINCSNDNEWHINNDNIILLKHTLHMIKNIYI